MFHLHLGTADGDYKLVTTSRDEQDPEADIGNWT